MKRFFRLQLALWILGVSPTLWGQAYLAEWKPYAGGPAVLIPVEEGKTPEQGLRAYLQGLLGVPAYREQAQRLMSSLELNVSAFSPLGSSQVETAVIANKMSHLLPGDERFLFTLELFRSLGGRPYVIAISADIALNENAREAFHREVASRFPLLVALGGDDIDRRLYGEKPQTAEAMGAIIFERDASELKLIRHYKEQGQGIFFGICRGHQMGAVADGYALHEDLTKSGVADTERHVRMGKPIADAILWHPIEMTVRNPALLKHLGEIPWVASLHHQAVNLSQGSPGSGAARVAARSPDGVVEALLGPRHIGLQFHPELSLKITRNSEFTNWGHRMLHKVIAYARLQRNRGSRAALCAKAVGAIAF